MYSFFSLAIVFRVLSEKFLFKMNQIKRLTAWVSMSCISLFFEIIKINIILRNVLTMFYVEYLFSGQIRTLATFHYTMNTKPSNRARAKTNTCFNTLCTKCAKHGFVSVCVRRVVYFFFHFPGIESKTWDRVRRTTNFTQHLPRSSEKRNSIHVCVHCLLSYFHLIHFPSAL